MKTLALIVSVTALLVVSPATAQNATYACQFIAAGGLSWEKGQWEETKFIKKSPFFLNSVNLKLTNESVGKALGAEQFVVFCHEKFFNTQSCGDLVGRALIFDFENLTGATSTIYGGVGKNNNRSRRDDLVIQTFTCTKM